MRGAFTLNSDAILLVGITPYFDPARISNITAGNIDFISEIIVDTNIPDYVITHLEANSYYAILNLNYEYLNNSAELIPNEGIITSGAFDYNYEVLWESEVKDVLNLHITDARFNPDAGGSDTINVPGVIELNNPTTTIIGERQNSVFNGLEDRTSRNFWVTPFYNLKQRDAEYDFSGYKLKTPGVVLGFDSDVSDNSFLGALVSFSWPDYYSNNTHAKGDDWRIGIYGGTSLKHDWELTYLATYVKLI